MEMVQELRWLLLALVFVAVMPLIYVANRALVRGPRLAVNDPQGSAGGALSPWAQRLRFAHANAVENLVIFAPAVLAIQLLGVSTPATAMAAMIWFGARIVHAAAYAANIGLVRTLAHVAAWVAQLFMLRHLLGWV